MATTAMDYENTNGDRFEDEPRYDRDRERSASPRPRDDVDGGRRRSASPTATTDDKPKDHRQKDDDDGAINPGSNLFVTGIAPILNEDEVTRLFAKYGEVEKCQIMRDPHTKESRGFGFVKMATSDQADAAKEGLQDEVIKNRSLCIEKARRGKPRTPTPGKYFGPPKRESRPRSHERRRGGGFGGYGGGGRDEPYRYRHYRDDDRSSGHRGDYERSYDRYDRDYDRDDRIYDRDDRGRGYREDRGGYDRRDRDGAYGGRVDRYGTGAGAGAGSSGRGDRDRFGPRGGASGYDRDSNYRDRYDRDGGHRSRDPPSANAAYESAPRSEAREPFGGSSY